MAKLVSRCRCSLELGGRRVVFLWFYGWASYGKCPVSEVEPQEEKGCFVFSMSE